VRIQLEIKNYRCFADDHPVRIDIREGAIAFVGVNNAGKSTLLRMLFELRTLFARVSEGQPLQPALNGNERGSNQITIDGVADQQEIFSNRNRRELTITVRVEGDEPDTLLPSALELSISRDRPTTFFARFNDGASWLAGTNFSASQDSDALRLGDTPVSPVGPYREAGQLLANALYIPAVRNAVQVGATQPYYDLQIGQAFVGAWDRFKAGPDKQSNERAREVEQEIGRIFALDDFQINAAEGNDTLQLFIGPKSYRLHELGAGLAQFIVVLGFAAIRRPALILLDEPELNLHPALQLDFLTTLATFSRSGVIFSTHNLGLARAAAETVYTVRRVEQGLSEVRTLEATPQLAQFAGELGFSAYHELGFERILVVEGSTDLKTVQRLMRSYGIEHQVLLMHLGGREQIHARGLEQLVELQRITPKVSVLIDSERDAEQEKLRERIEEFVDGCAAAAIPCHVLARRAIENYFPEDAIQRAIGDRYAALAPFERLGATREGWSKRDNWRIADEMSRSDLDGTDLDEFFSALATEE
jgi:ABC-type Mn2+/Zn2+ transport system ATPase subunit/5S rRNA maturation endonuclease (ribonuclease M5)